MGISRYDSESIYSVGTEIDSPCFPTMAWKNVHGSARSPVAEDHTTPFSHPEINIDMRISKEDVVHRWDGPLNRNNRQPNLDSESERASEDEGFRESLNVETGSSPCSTVDQLSPPPLDPLFKESRDEVHFATRQNCSPVPRLEIPPTARKHNNNKNAVKSIPSIKNLIPRSSSKHFKDGDVESGGPSEKLFKRISIIGGNWI